jgi:hypothetical protein
MRRVQVHAALPGPATSFLHGVLINRTDDLPAGTPLNQQSGLGHLT